MADNSEDEFASFESVFSSYIQDSESDDKETEEPPRNDDSNNDDPKNVVIVEQEPVPILVRDPEPLTLEDLANSDFIRNRQLAAKSIVECLRKAESNKEALHAVISVMCKLSEDEDIMVRSELIEQIPSIAIFCKERSEDLGVVIRQQIVPYTVKLLTDTQKQVRKIGHTTMLVLLENNVIDHSQLSEWICPLIAQLATSENTPEDLRLEDVSVMCKMIPYVGKEITEKFFLEPFLSLCRDTAWSPVLQVCMLNFGNISQVIGRETTETTLLSAFLDLCQEESCEVKSRCVDIAVELASVVSSTTRNEILSRVYMTFLKHESHSVWYPAKQSLGRFISTFADPSKTGLSYNNGMWTDTPFEDKDIEDLQNNENYFELLTSEIISNPQFLDECSFKNLNSCLLDNCSYGDLPQTVSSSDVNNSKLNFGVITFDSSTGLINDSDIDFFQSPKYELSQSSSKDAFGSKILNDYCQFFDSSKCQWAQPFSERDCALSEEISDQNSNVNSELSNLQNTSNCENRPVNNSPLTLETNNKHLYQHKDNENDFNNFQYWRTPLPEVELDVDVEECKSESINLRNRLDNKEDIPQSCTSESNVRMLSKQSAKEPDNTLHKRETDAISNEDENDSSKLVLRFDSHFFKYTFEKSECHRNNYSAPDNIKKQMTKEEIKPIVKEKIIYDQDIVPPDLLMEFIDNLWYAGDLRLNIAYYFPSVAYTLGRKYWPCMRELFNFLATDVKCQVRRTVASSLHELAVILGQDITTEDLLPVFLDMLRNDIVSSALIKNISEFLKKLKPHARRQFLPLIEGICSWFENDCNWRYRLTVAEQFIPCVELYSSSEALHFLPVSLLLMQDKVSAVRKSAVELLAVIIKSMGTNSKSSNFLKAALHALDEKYRKANKWLWRQMYVFICEELAVKRSLPTDFYVNEIVPNLFTLAWDTVPNVRLAVARCLGLTLLPLDFLPSIQKTHYQLLLQVMYSLQSDVDRDVRHFALLSAAAFNVLPPKKESHGAQFNKCQEWWEKSD